VISVGRSTPNAKRRKRSARWSVNVWPQKRGSAMSWRVKAILIAVVLVNLAVFVGAALEIRNGARRWRQRRSDRQKLRELGRLSDRWLERKVAGDESHEARDEEREAHTAPGAFT
jgi:hypothetical protein